MKRAMILVLTVSLLLLASCQQQPQAPTTVPPATQAVPPTTEPTFPTETEPDASVSLVSLRQALVETPQKFAVAYLGLLEAENTDPVAFIRRNTPNLCADLPFLTAMEQADVVGSTGELYCIVPAENSTVVLNRILRDEYGWIIGSEAFLVRDTDAPFLLLCNEQESPDTELVITDADGKTITWQVMLDYYGCVAVPRNDEYEALAMDFSGYAEMLEAEYHSLAENGWFVPAAQDLTGTSWCWDTWVDYASLYLEYEILFEEGNAFVRWYDNDAETYSVCEAVPWTLESMGDAAVLKLDFGGFAGERSYNILLQDGGKSIFIMADVITGDPVLGMEALRRYMGWSDLCQAPDPMEMVGSWQRLYYEVEGYRENSEPGEVTLAIEGDSEEFLTISYTRKAFPDSGYTNQSLVVAPREMFDGCGNSRWVADVQHQGNDETTWTVTLLSDGQLLLQTFWIMDGTPMVSYEWFARIG